MDPAINYDWMKLYDEPDFLSDSLDSTDRGYTDTWLLEGQESVYHPGQRRVLEEWTPEKIQEWQHYMKIHGVLMLLAWGFFLPAAIASSLLLRHRNQHPRYPFWRCHWILAGIGTTLAIAGWIVGLKHFDTLADGPHVDEEDSSLAWTGENAPYAHAVLGMVVMVGAIFNVCLYACMSKPKRDGETFLEYSRLRQVGHMTHRILGHAWIILGLVTCGIGTRITYSQDYNAKFLKSFVGLLFATLVVMGMFWMDKMAWYQHAKISNDKEAVVNESSQLVEADV